MSGAIIVEKIRYRTSRSYQIELRGMIRLDQIRKKASGEKIGILEKSKTIMEREKICDKREKKSVLRI